MRESFGVKPFVILYPDHYGYTIYTCVKILKTAHQKEKCKLFFIILKIKKF